MYRRNFFRYAALTGLFFSSLSQAELPTKPYDKELFRFPQRNLGKIPTEEAKAVVDSLQDKIKKTKGKEEKLLLGYSLAALYKEQGAYDKCDETLTVKPDYLLADHIAYLLATCKTKRGESLLREKPKRKQATKLLQEAEKLLLGFERTYPGSVFIDDATQLLVDNERLQGEDLMAQQAYGKAVVFLEKALLRTNRKGPTELALNMLYINALAHLKRSSEAKGRLGFLESWRPVPEQLGTFKEQMTKTLPKDPTPSAKSSDALPTFRSRDPLPVVNQDIFSPTGIENAISLGNAALAKADLVEFEKIFAAHYQKFYFFRSFRTLMRTFQDTVIQWHRGDRRKAPSWEHIARVLKNYGAPELLEFAADLRKQQLFPESEKVYEIFVSRFPIADGIDDALYSLARIKEDAGEFPKALQYFTMVSERYQESKLFEHSLWKTGWLNYRLGFHDRAVEFFQRYLGQNRYSQFQTPAMYWLTVCYDKLGKKKEAEDGLASLGTLFPFTFYGTLARIQTKRGVADLFADSIPLNLGDRPRDLSFAEATGLAKAERLLAVDLEELAARELATINFSNKGLGFSVYGSGLLRGSGEHHKSIAAIQPLFESLAPPLPTILAKLYFPDNYAGLLKEKLQGSVSPYWLLSLMRQESMFKPDAVSTAKAYGLMQLLLSTAKRVSGKNDLTEEQLKEPLTSIEMGTALIQKLVQRYNKSIPHVLAAYNAGEEAVDVWNRYYGTLPILEFIESIPYKETRNYVKLITRNYVYYTYLYGGKQFADLADIYRVDG